jgi:hypothetical protein
MTYYHPLLRTSVTFRWTHPGPHRRIALRRSVWVELTRQAMALSADRFLRMWHM